MDTYFYPVVNNTFLFLSSIEHRASSYVTSRHVTLDEFRIMTWATPGRCFFPTLYLCHHRLTNEPTNEPTRERTKPTNRQAPIRPNRTFFVFHPIIAFPFSHFRFHFHFLPY